MMMAAAGSAAVDPAMSRAGSQANPPAMDPNTPLSEVPAQCRGFAVLGLRTSPGGSVLPNTCAPFDGTLNNPYAIRCVDADPSYKTRYPGDEYCILPPAEDLGVQIHVAPDSYDNAGEFELAPNVETTAYYSVNAPNTESHYYYRTNWRMRPGGHHMLVTLQDGDTADGWSAFGDMGSDFGGPGKSFGGSQRPSVDRPQGTLDVPAENVGLGAQLAARQQFSFNLHSINTSSGPVLREIWVNVWYLDASDVTAPMQSFTGLGNPADMAIAAGRKVKLEYACAITGEARIIAMYGHYHAHGRRFGTWVVRASGEKVSVYESFNWTDIPVYQFDSVTMNPAPDVTNMIDGAASGELVLHAGDALHFECDVDNDSERALSFANEALTGEMCILFGSYTGASPCADVRRAN